MTETTVTFEPLRIETLDDVRGIDANTNNRAAVRSLRHAAREALLRAAKWDGYKALSHVAIETTSLGCHGSETREDWLVKLATRDNIDTVASAAVESLDAHKGVIADQVAIAKACLAKAEEILQAHPEGLPQDEVVQVMQQYSGGGFPLEYTPEMDDEGESLEDEVEW